MRNLKCKKFPELRFLSQPCRLRRVDQEIKSPRLLIEEFNLKKFTNTIRYLYVIIIRNSNYRKFMHLTINLLLESLY